MLRKSTFLPSLVALIVLGMGSVRPALSQPKNVIFLIGDGMGPEQVRAAGMYAYGQPGTLSFEAFPFSGELTNQTASGAVPDSAAAGTALATGVKVNTGVISVAIPGDGSELETLLEYSRALGKSTGLVSTKFMTDATPAAFGAHESSRMNSSQIAEDYRTQTRPNVLFGGGGSGMSVQAFENAGYTVVTDRDGMQALDTENIDMVCGQFGGGNLPFEPDVGPMPHLSEMTVTALQILDNDPDGFFLMIEGAQIDTAGHSNLTENMIFETLEFDNAVQVAIDWAQGRTDTLIIVTADHETGGLSVEANNGAGVLPTVEWTSGNHSGVNVPIYAWGVNAVSVSGVMDNTEVFGVVTAGPQARKPDPQDGETGVWLPPVLTWTPGIYAASHEVYFGTAFDDVSNAVGATPQAEATYTPSGPLAANSTYYWRVDEVNDLHPDSPWVGNVWTFTTAPGNSSQPDPSDKATAVAIDATLSWVPGPTAATHNVYFGAASPPAFIGNQGEAAFYPGPLEPGTTYYWQIDEVEADGATTFAGDVWSFTTVPGYAAQPDPADGGLISDLDRALSWLPGPTAATHDVYFGTTSPPPFAGNYEVGTFYPGPLDAKTTYYWKVDEIEADGTTTYTGDIWSFRTARPGTGVILFEVWGNIMGFGAGLAALTGNPDYPDNPVAAAELTSFDAPANIGDFFGGRLHGYLQPETSGDYTFWIASDDQGELWLSTDDSPANAVLICRTDRAVGRRDFSNPSVRPSDSIHLEAGGKYYIMALYVEIWQNDHCAVAWEGPDSPSRSVIDGYYLSPFVNFWASRPDPVDGAPEVGNLLTTLSWKPSVSAVSHDVYFGTDRQAVVDGTAFIVNQSQTSYYPGFLAKGATYYWRIDEVEADGTVHVGAIWSFTVTTRGR